MPRRRDGESTAAVRVISGYPDLVHDGNLGIDEADAIAQAFNAGVDPVICVPEWLSAKTGISGGRDCPTVLAGEIRAESAKAYLVAVGGRQNWLPKSQIVLYERAPDAAIYTPAPARRPDHNHADRADHTDHTRLEPEER